MLAFGSTSMVHAADNRPDAAMHPSVASTMLEKIAPRDVSALVTPIRRQLYRCPDGRRSGAGNRGRATFPTLRRLLRSNSSCGGKTRKSTRRASFIADEIGGTRPFKWMNKLRL
jgi:hypothetical protein